MRKIYSIELGLENCEVIEIKKEHIGIFRLEDIKRSMRGNAINGIRENLHAEEFYLQICSQANKHSSFTCTWHDGDVTPFDRMLNDKDLVSIHIHYDDGTDEYVYVNWVGDSDHTNPIQTAAVNKHTGDLYIAVSENEKVEDYFKLYLEDEEGNYTRWEFSAYKE